jgi:hypothetical protein
MKILLGVVGALVLLVAGFVVLLAVTSSLGLAERSALLVLASLLIWTAARLQRRAAQHSPIS